MYPEIHPAVPLPRCEGNEKFTQIPLLTNLQFHKPPCAFHCLLFRIVDCACCTSCASRRASSASRCSSVHSVHPCILCIHASVPPAHLRCLVNVPVRGTVTYLSCLRNCVDWVSVLRHSQKLGDLGVGGSVGVSTHTTFKICQRCMLSFYAPVWEVEGCYVCNM